MSLTLYFHPLSSFCQKVLVALYENDTPFKPHIVDLSDPAQSEALKKLWPIRKFPVVRDDKTGEVVAESTVIIDYLDQHYPGATRFVPEDPDAARRVRMSDRFFDLYIHLQMQKVVGDRLRPADKKDPLGVEQARAQMHTALGVVDDDLRGKTWAAGDAFTLADCSACPALYYANLLMPLTPYPNVSAYYERLLQRPSFARVVREAAPYRHMFPQ